MTAAPIAFVDTETLGLDAEAPIWEFAAIKRTYNDDTASPVSHLEQTMHLFIEHIPWPWLETLPAEFRNDYQQRYDPAAALPAWRAAPLIHDFLAGAHVVGAVPSFDTVRLGRLLERHGLDPEPWHYHLVDVENMAVGYLAGRGQLLDPPWKSNALSAAIGVDPDDYDRHTAMGDVLWCRDQYDAIMLGGANERASA